MGHALEKLHLAAGCPGWQSKLRPSFVAVTSPLTLFEHGKKITFAAFVKYQEIFFSDDYF
jgi:hypothetical protein